MSLLTIPLGYRKTGTVELDTFTRLLNNQIRDNEEVRVDKPVAYTGAVYEYVGIALAGSSIVSPVWHIVRKSMFNKQTIRIQYQSNIAWSDREDNWPL